MSELLIADAAASTPIHLLGRAAWDTLAPTMAGNIKATLERAGFSGAAGDLALDPGLRRNADWPESLLRHG